MFLNESINYLVNENLQIFDKQKNDSIKLKNEYLKLKNYYLDKLNGKEVIGIYLEKSYKYVLNILVLMEIGITFVPLNKKWPSTRNEQIIQLAACDYIICDFQDKRTNFLNYEEIIQTNFDRTKENFILNKNPLYIIFTSGSTGTPKGVEISREAYSNFLKWLSTYFTKINQNDNLLNTADFTFDLSMIDIGLLIVKKLNFYISDFDNNVFKLLLEIQTNKITTIATVPNNINLLINDKILRRGDISSLRNLLLGGARFSYGLYKDIFKKIPNAEIFNLYGPTEATVYCSAIKLENKEGKEVIEHSVTIGKAIDNMDIKIFDDFFIEESFKKGELLISGKQLMNGYVNNPKMNKKTLVHIENTQYYKTGDLGFMDDNQNIYVNGRLDDTIKISGYRVNLSDIDSLIGKLNYIEDLATIAIESEEKENILITYIKITEKIDKNKIIEDLKEIMPSYQLPSEIYFLDNFPLNTSGKISKKELKNIYLGNKND